MRITREQLIFLVLTGGFFTLAFEVKQLHQELLAEKWQAHIPIYFSFLSILASLAGLTAHRLLRSLAAAIFGLGCVVGLAGLYFHSDGEPSKVVEPFVGALTAHAKNGEDEGEGIRKDREKDSEPPPLAPAGITGLSSIGLILAWPGKRDRR